MSLASNLMNGITSIQQGGTYGVSSPLNMNDSTFSDILEKAMGNSINENMNTEAISAIPSGFPIEELTISKDTNMTAPDKINKELLDFAQKQALNSYYKYSGSVITNISEFVEDALNLNKTLLN